MLNGKSRTPIFVAVSTFLLSGGFQTCSKDADCIAACRQAAGNDDLCVDAACDDWHKKCHCGDAGAALLTTGSCAGRGSAGGGGACDPGPPYPYRVDLTLVVQPSPELSATDLTAGRGSRALLTMLRYCLAEALDCALDDVGGRSPRLFVIEFKRLAMLDGSEAEVAYATIEFDFCAAANRSDLVEGFDKKAFALRFANEARNYATLQGGDVRVEDVVWPTTTTTTIGGAVDEAAAPATEGTDDGDSALGDVFGNLWWLWLAAGVVVLCCVPALCLQFFRLRHRRGKALPGPVGKTLDACRGKYSKEITQFDDGADASDQELEDPPSGSRKLVQYVVDNSKLKSKATAIYYRRTKELEDHDKDVPPVEYGGVVWGIDEGDGWVKVGKHFLPVEVRGHQVLRLRDAAVEPFAARSASSLSSGSEGVPRPTDPPPMLERRPAPEEPPQILHQESAHQLQAQADLHPQKHSRSQPRRPTRLQHQQQPDVLLPGCFSVESPTEVRLPCAVPESPIPLSPPAPAASSSGPRRPKKLGRLPGGLAEASRNGTALDAGFRLASKGSRRAASKRSKGTISHSDYFDDAPANDCGTSSDGRLVRAPSFSDTHDQTVGDLSDDSIVRVPSFSDCFDQVTKSCDTSVVRAPSFSDVFDSSLVRAPSFSDRFDQPPRYKAAPSCSDCHTAQTLEAPSSSCGPTEEPSVHVVDFDVVTGRAVAMRRVPSFSDCLMDSAASGSKEARVASKRSGGSLRSSPSFG
mmetsp:Transcript_48775/g.136494  ORF Transcript_48775/g.136494 Transcript_48775/m.136494 type:complete len:750 (-) Transcript_48775:111-2360(-)